MNWNQLAPLMPDRTQVRAVTGAVTCCAKGALCWLSPFTTRLHHTSSLITTLLGWPPYTSTSTSAALYPTHYTPKSKLFNHLSPPLPRPPLSYDVPDKKKKACFPLVLIVAVVSTQL